MRCLLLLTAILHAQVVVTQPGGGPFHSITVTPSGQTIAVNARSIYDVRDSGFTEIAKAPEGVTLTAADANDGFAVLAGTIGADMWIGTLSLPDGLLSNTKRIPGNTPNRMVLDRSRNIHITGSTANGDGFIIKLNGDLNLVYERYVQGAFNDDLQDVVVDSSGSAYVVGVSNSAELAIGAQGAPAFASTDEITYSPTGSGSFRATVQAWLTPNANVIYAGTAGQGIFRSSDLGQTWEPINQGITNFNVTSLAGNGQLIYAGTTSAVFRSVNGGTSWTQVNDLGISSIATGSNEAVYTGFRNPCGLARSPDGSRFWVLQRPLQETCVTALFSTSDGTYAFTNTGVFREVGSNEPWQKISDLAGVTSIVDWYAVVPGKGVYKSDDQGRTWKEFYAGKAISIASANGRTVIGTSDQGLLDLNLNRIDGGAIQQPVRSVAISGTAVFVGTEYLPDTYIAKISPSGDRILYSAFIGGTGVESSPRLALDTTSNNLLVAMASTSTDITATFDAVQRRNAGGSDVVLARVTPAFDVLNISYYGGEGADVPGRIAVDSRGFVHLAGSTTLSVLTPNFGSILYSSNLGEGKSLSLGGANSAWVAGGNPGTDGLAVHYTDLVTSLPIGVVRNAASLVSGAIAPSSTIIIEGTGFGTSFSGLSVKIGDSDANVLQLSDTQIEVAAPADLEPGAAAPIRITTRAGLFQGSVPVDRLSPGVFSANRDGKGVALASILRIDADDNTTVSPVYECVDGPGSCTAVPIEAGDPQDQLFLLLRATGIRNRRSLDDVTVTLNGAPAEVTLAEAIDDFTGADRIVVKLPSDLGTSGGVRELTIVVTVEGKSANPVTITISS
jgi:uncharacterized protein (TIGR03437 family)